MNIIKSIFVEPISERVDKILSFILIASLQLFFICPLVYQTFKIFELTISNDFIYILKCIYILSAVSFLIIAFWGITRMFVGNFISLKNIRKRKHEKERL